MRLALSLELRPLPPPALPSFIGITGLSAPHRARPVLTGVRLAIPGHAMGFPVLRALSLCACCRHYPGAADGRRLALSPNRTSLPRYDGQVGPHDNLFEFAELSLALRPAHSRCHQFVTRYPKASAISLPP